MWALDKDAQFLPLCLSLGLPSMNSPSTPYWRFCSCFTAWMFFHCLCSMSSSRWSVDNHLFCHPIWGSALHSPSTRLILFHFQALELYIITLFCRFAHSCLLSLNTSFIFWEFFQVLSDFTIPFPLEVAGQFLLITEKKGDFSRSWLQVPKTQENGLGHLGPKVDCFCPFVCLYHFH